ncbi:methyl-accepting chemotaxis protein [uncultured Kushneria sp.]|uniref:methyl-accepting chemotaxis protein n=1 Tax=uncultured Kushneria sp. TaxID=905033 RepID=UPI002624BFF4|nr:methyl-accepting chemotaxis protein [uncultured Kushneria sp.]
MLTSIRTRILVFCLAIVLMALTLTGIATYYVTSQYNTQSITHSQAAVAEGYTMAISEWSHAKKGVVEATGRQALTEDALSRFILAADAGDMITVYAGFNDDRYITSDVAWEIPPTYRPTQRPWYQQAVAAGHTIATLPYLDASSGKLVVSFASPIVRDGQTVGVISSDVAMDSVIETVNAVDPTPRSHAFMVNDEGVMIAHADKSLILKPATELDASLTPAALSQMTGSNTLRDVTLRGQKVMLSAVPIEGTNWTLVMALDRGEAMAGMVSLVKTTVVALIVVGILAALVIWALLTPIFRRMHEVRDAMQDVSAGEGDLSQRLPLSARNDEVNQIAASFNRFVERIDHVMSDVRDSSENVRMASSEISTGSMDLSRRTETTAASLEQSAAAMEQLTSTVANSTESSRHAAQLTAQATKAAEEGGQVMTEVVGTMSDISASSSEIANIIGVIDSIAFQTNLLALNASVEAARAGEQGRGFAVVAAEVRTLANRSTQAARDIKQLIDASVTKTVNGQALVQRAGERMEDIVSQIKRVNGLISEVTTAANEQNTGISQVNQAVTQLDQMTQENAALVEESAAASDSLSQEAQRLSQIIGVFRLSERTPA